MGEPCLTVGQVAIPQCIHEPLNWVTVKREGFGEVQIPVVLGQGGQVVRHLDSFPVFRIEPASFPVDNGDDDPSSILVFVHHDIGWAEIAMCKDAPCLRCWHQVAHELDPYRADAATPGKDEILELLGIHDWFRRNVGSFSHILAPPSLDTPQWSIGGKGKLLPQRRKERVDLAAKERFLGLIQLRPRLLQCQASDEGGEQEATLAQFHEAVRSRCRKGGQVLL